MAGMVEVNQMSLVDQCLLSAKLVLFMADECTFPKTNLKCLLDSCGAGYR